MAYSNECTGTPVVDKSNTTEGFNVLLGLPHAIAQKFTPSSLCLESVTIKVGQIYAGTSGVTVYITPDVSGLPSNTNWIGSSYGYYTRQSNEVSTLNTLINFPLNIKLPNLNPVWIVVVPSIYDPNYDDGYYYLELPVGDVITTGTAMKVKNSNWSLRSGEILVYKTFKTNVVAQCPALGITFQVQ